MLRLVSVTPGTTRILSDNSLPIRRSTSSSLPLMVMAKSLPPIMEVIDEASIIDISAPDKDENSFLISSIISHMDRSLFCFEISITLIEDVCAPRNAEVRPISTLQ